MQKPVEHSRSSSVQSRSRRSITVVIRSYSRTEEIFRLLDGLRWQTLPPSEIVVIDSGSSASVVNTLKSLVETGLRRERVQHRASADQASSGIPFRLLCIPNEEYQSARSLNRVIADARHELIAILSQDAVPFQDYLEKLTQGFDDPGLAGAYGRQIAPAPKDPLVEKDLLKTYPAQSRIQSNPDCWFVNTCSIIRKSLWERHHFAEEARISEDHEWALWAQRQGCKIHYEADAIVVHYHDCPTFGQIWDRFYEEGAGLAYVYQSCLPIHKVFFNCRREVLADSLWLGRRFMLWHIPPAILKRLIKHAAYYLGWRNFQQGKAKA